MWMWVHSQLSVFWISLAICGICKYKHMWVELEDCISLWGIYIHVYVYSTDTCSHSRHTCRYLGGRYAPNKIPLEFSGSAFYITACISYISSSTGSHFYRIYSCKQTLTLDISLTYINLIQGISS